MKTNHSHSQFTPEYPPVQKHTGLPLFSTWHNPPFKHVNVSQTLSTTERINDIKMKDNTVSVEVQKIIQILVLFVSNCYKVIKIIGFRSACK